MIFAAAGDEPGVRERTAACGKPNGKMSFN
jgi:hypothetical protein